MNDFWTAGAARCYVSREFFKNYAYLIMYGWKGDPWICHIINEELQNGVSDSRLQKQTANQST